MGKADIERYLSHLAVQRKVAASTQNQALNAIVYLYHQVLEMEIGQLEDVVRAKRPQRLPVVFTHDEVLSLLAHLHSSHWKMAQLLYGSGLRLSECVRLRVKDVDFNYKQIIVRDDKGKKDRVTLLPRTAIPALEQHLERVHRIHDQDLELGFGAVYLPNALSRKYPSALKEWAWQYVFPAAKRSTDPRSGVVHRHHVGPQSLQRAVKQTIRSAGIRAKAGKLPHSAS